MMHLGFIIAVCSIVVASCTSDLSGGGEYDADEIIAMRQEKDAQFSEGNESPIPADKRSSFRGLAYFGPDPAYAVPATFSESAKADTLTLQTSKDDVRKAVRVGKFLFQINGKELELAAYTFVDKDADESYFVPFTDMTSGHESYYGGRYLNVAIQDDDDYVLDFNLAYNPYCAYNENYSCPLVPKENELDIAIRAGEKK